MKVTLSVSDSNRELIEDAKKLLPNSLSGIFVASVYADVTAKKLDMLYNDLQNRIIAMRLAILKSGKKSNYVEVLDSLDEMLEHMDKEDEIYTLAHDAVIKSGVIFESFVNGVDDRVCELEQRLEEECILRKEKRDEREDSEH